MPLAYLNFGGFGSTQGIIRSTRVGDFSKIKNIIFPNDHKYNGGKNLRQSDWDRIKFAHLINGTALSEESNLLEGKRKNRQFYFDAFNRAEGIRPLVI